MSPFPQVKTLQPSEAFPWYTDDEFAADFIPQKKPPLIQIGGAQ
jgi:hypothetical protein